MKQKLKAVFKGPVVFHPLLFAAFPILFLYVYNISETSMSQVWLPLGVSMAGALVLWAVLSLILRSLSKGGFATAIFLVFFFSYGRLYDVLEAWGVSVKHAYLLSTMLFIWGYCVYFISRAKRDFRITTRMLNIAAVVLIVINLFNIVSYQIRLARLEAVAQGPSQEQAANATTNQENLEAMPDIYYIVPDSYDTARSVSEQYNYDNSPFVNWLISKGFFIASESKSRYPVTYLSLGSSLNMEYIPDTEAVEVVHQKINHNKVANLLKAYGYKYIHIGSWWSPTMYTSDADVNVSFYKTTEHGTAPVEFVGVLWKTTMLRPFYNLLYSNQNQSYFRLGIINTLDYLKKVPDIDVGGPKFVFAHIICPHGPWVFGANGEPIDPANWCNPQFYLGQYIFIAGEIEKVVDALLEKSIVPPIVIIQSDTGFLSNWEKIFNAYYLPGDGKNQLYDNISPVNSFRIIFNHYFGENYELLED
jgi:hypothetical protein